MWGMAVHLVVDVGSIIVNIKESGMSHLSLAGALEALDHLET